MEIYIRTFYLTFSINPIPLNIKNQPKALGGCQIGTRLHFTM